MADGLDLVVTGAGLCSPVGLTAASTCAALRAGIARIGEVRTAYVDGEQVESVPAVGGRVPLEWLDGHYEEPEWPGHDRFGVEAPDSPLTMTDWFCFSTFMSRYALSAVKSIKRNGSWYQDYLSWTNTNISLYLQK